MDVAFGMRGAAQVVIVDAASTGAEPGTVYRVPAEELADLPPIDGLHTHNFRWDHALSFSTWLLGPERPTDVTVYLVEAASLEPGAPLTPAVEAGMWRVVELVERDHFPKAVIELTADGYLHLPAALAARHFPGDALVARLDDSASTPMLELVPLASVGHGGLLLKHRNAAGDRSALIHQELDFAPVAGRFEVEWDDDRGALLVPLDPAPDGSHHGDRGAHRGGGRTRPVDGLPRGDHAGGSRAPAAGDAPHGGTGDAGGRRRTPHGGAAASTEEGPR
jgi:hydrogenase maturation protease